MNKELLYRIVLAVMLTALLNVSYAGIRYVKPTAGGTGDGSSWANASANLQAMINASGSGDEVWVAAGTYKPTTTTDRTISFVMKNGVAIYGGFPNTGNPGFADRNWTANVTTLSGDIGTVNNNSDNSYHVILNNNNNLTATALLDGFTISGGNANGGGIDNNGGGMRNVSSSPSVTNCSFSGNQAINGGGMFNNNSSPSVTHCSFLGNLANEFGGGMYNQSSSPSVTNCTFSGNRVNMFNGGGMLNGFSSAPTLTNCTFSGNQAFLGGGLSNFSPSAPTLKNCLLWGNSSEVSISGDTMTIENTIVQGGCPAGATCTSVLNVNPFFVSQPPIGLGTTGDLRLVACSPAIDAGDNAAVPSGITTDLDGNPRFFNNGIVDMGAYEYQGTVTAARTWTGALSTDWHTADNWSPACVPTAENHAIIPSAANAPVIQAGTAALANSVHVQTDASLTIGATGSLTINGSAAYTSPFNFTTGLNNQGTVSNSGDLILGSVSSVGDWGIYNQATFQNNTGGDIQIDRSSSIGLYNISGTFTNAAKITIGANESVGGGGIWNEATFHNNAGGDIHIDRSSSKGLFNFSGTFTNAAKITIGANESVGDEGIDNNATFHNNAGGDIQIDRSSSSGLCNFSGIFTNAANIIIGANASVGSYGIENRASFQSNTGGDIQIDRSSSSGVYNLLTFTNAAKITIGANASVGSSGIDNGGTFQNNTGGDIQIDRSSFSGLYNTVSGIFMNAAKITIGANANVGEYGIWNYEIFQNNTGGDIRIDRSSNAGLYNNFNNTFTNAAKITIGANESVGDYGIYNRDVFQNNTGGDIQIDRSSSSGVYNDSGTFTNTAKITIGANHSVGNHGLWNEATFQNDACAEIYQYAPLFNDNTLTNGGLMLVSTTSTHSNTALTNNGIIAYPLGNPIPNVVNNEIIIAPTTATDCQGVGPAFGLGSPVDFTIAGVYTDAAATMSAGAYVTATNRFTAAALLPNGAAYDYFVKIEDGAGACTRIVPWQLTVPENTTPSAPTGTLTITNSTCTNCSLSGGSIALGTVSGSGGTLEYSTDNGATWSSALPTYNQTGPAQAILASVLAANGCRSNSTQVGMTAPGECVTPAAPTGDLAITNSTCTNCMVSGGSIALGTVSGTGGTLEYSTDNGATWSSALPSYNQDGPAQVILASVLAANGCRSNSAQVGMTAPGECVTPSAPTLVITDNTCPSSDGVIAAMGCGTGTVAEYATGLDGPWSASPPAYGTTAFTVYARCRDEANGCISGTGKGTTSPTDCPVLSGNIVWEHDRIASPAPVPAATVILSGDGTGNSDTDANGDYAIPTAGGNLTLTPSKTTGDPYGGVDAADVTRIQQHVTFMDRFDDGYKVIAADVNKSNSVTGQDAAVLFHAINGNPSAQAIFQTPSWRFVDAAHTFGDENSPWPFPEDISQMNVMADVVGQDFVGVKMGDVNGTWGAPPAPLTAPLNWTVPNLTLKAGQTLRIPFRANGLPDVVAWQFALRFDTDYLRFERALPTAAFPLKDENFGAWQADAGELRSVFAVPQGLVLPKDEAIFELEFQVIQDGLRLSEALRLDNGILDGRVYNTALNGGAVDLTFEAVETRRIASLLPGEAAFGFALEQNIPNPFSNETLIRFQLLEAGEAVFSVHDMMGRLLYEQGGFLDAGWHDVRLDAARLGATGVLSYTLRFRDAMNRVSTGTRRMVLVR